MSRVSSFLSSASPSQSTSASPAALRPAASASSPRARSAQTACADWAAPCAASQSIRKGLIAGVVAAVAVFALSQSLAARADAPLGGFLAQSSAQSR